MGRLATCALGATSAALELPDGFGAVDVPAHSGNAPARSSLELEAEQDRLNKLICEPNLDQYLQGSTDPRTNSAVVQEAACIE
jgi:hypothetical protein